MTKLNIDAILDQQSKVLADMVGDRRVTGAAVDGALSRSMMSILVDLAEEMRIELVKVTAERDEAVAQAAVLEARLREEAGRSRVLVTHLMTKLNETGFYRDADSASMADFGGENA